MLTSEQRLMRQKYLGGSDAAAVIGVSKYKTPVGLYLEKTGYSEPEDISSKPWIVAGNKLEPVIRKWFTEVTGLEAVEEHDTIFNPKYPWMCANIDGRIKGTNEILEIKTSRSAKDWGKDGEFDIFPDDYRAQVAHYCIVTGADRCHIAVLINGTDFRTYIYERNPRLEDYLINEERKFWSEHVLKEVAPLPKTEAEVKALVGLMVKDEPIIATPNVESAMYEYNSLERDIKELEKEQSRLRNEICVFMNDKQLLLDGHGRPLLRWKLSKGRSNFDRAALKEAHPDIEKTYTMVGEPVRQFKPIVEKE